MNESATATAPAVSRRPTRRLPGSNTLMVWIALAALVVVCAVMEPGTLGASTLRSMLPFASVLVVAAIGQCLTVQSGGIDLSVPGSMALAAAVVVQYAEGQDERLALAVVLALAAVMVGGVLNGFAIAVLRIPPIVATLAVNALLVGALQTYTGGVLKGAPQGLVSLSSKQLFGIPNLVYVAAVFVLLSAVVVYSTIWGRRLVAVGAQSASARAAGVPVSRYVIATYAAAAFCYGVAGIMLAGYLQTPAASMADSYLFSTLTAVIIGGTAFGGGRGRIVGTAVGAVFISQLNIFLAATGSPTSVTYILQALAIAVAVSLNRQEAGRAIRRLIATRGSRSPRGAARS